MSSKFEKVIRCEEFLKDFKKLIKRYRSLEEDLETFIKALLVPFHKYQINNHGIFHINNLGFNSPKIYKAKKFACKYLKGKGARSGIRVIYSYIPHNNEIYLIEIYSKNDKEMENRKRLFDFKKSLDIGSRVTSAR